MRIQSQEPGVDARTHRFTADCLQTYAVCLETATYLLDSEGARAEALHIRLLLDCADLHLVLVNLCTRRSPFARGTARLCAEVSKACADALEGEEHEAAQLRAAYAACRRSFQACGEWTGTLPETRSEAYDDVLAGSFPASDPPPAPTQL